MEVKVLLDFFLNLCARWGWWLTPRPGRLTPGNNSVLIVLQAGWGPRTVWTGAENRASTGTRSPDRPAHDELITIQLQQKHQWEDNIKMEPSLISIRELMCGGKIRWMF